MSESWIFVKKDFSKHKSRPFIANFHTLWKASGQWTGTKSASVKNSEFRVQWNLDITKGQFTGKICAL